MTFGMPAVRRTWTVEPRSGQEGRVLVCSGCGPYGVPVLGGDARAAVLAHLAQHARRDALATHLRSCQCFEQGCRWHARQRGCSGPVLLAVSRTKEGRAWRLADVCVACAHGTAHTAIVPDTLLQVRSSPASKGTGCYAPRRTALRDGTRALGQVRDMLTYLSSALPAWVGPEPRLLALQCALRRDAHKGVWMRQGLLRSMRLAHSPAAWCELEEARWLIRIAEDRHSRRGSAIHARIFDVLAPTPSRSERARAADWALRVVGHRTVRQRTASVRLAVLALAAHGNLDSAGGVVEADGLARACGLSREALFSVLDQVTATGIAANWRLDTGVGDVHWHLAVQLGMCQSHPSRPGEP